MSPIDFSSIFQNVSVAGVNLLVFTIALVQWIKASFGLEGKAVRFTAMGAGVLLGLAHQLSLAIPATFEGWFSTIVFGLLLGLGASGVYDAASDIAANYASG